MTTTERDEIISLPLLTLPADDKFVEAVKNLHQKPRTFVQDALSGFLHLTDTSPQGALTQLLETPSPDPDSNR